jgi:acyl-CoA reductase-like NAD-dependent aldehyde dehydrogenase
VKLLIKTLDKVLAALANARNFKQRPQDADENLTSKTSDEVLELLHYLSDQATEDGGKSFISEIRDRVMAIIEENDKDAAK